MPQSPYKQFLAQQAARALQGDTDDTPDPVAEAYAASLPFFDPSYAAIMVTDERRKRHITCERLAAMTGIPFNTLSAYERGKRNLPLERLNRIAEALTLPPEHFYRVPKVY